MLERFDDGPEIFEIFLGHFDENCEYEREMVSMSYVSHMQDNNELWHIINVEWLKWDSAPYDRTFSMA